MHPEHKNFYNLHFHSQVVKTHYDSEYDVIVIRVDNERINNARGATASVESILDLYKNHCQSFRFDEIYSYYYILLTDDNSNDSFCDLETCVNKRLPIFH